ncbi:MULTISPECIES: DUF4347 domain-containing protein, partial [Spirulina sp. CCY15215]|uniref:DUF4347 domain-containing protein n=1 Tax=Spirulina sp. CCY15215 TaxID=2767591 RepID=UPI001951B9F4
AITAEGNEGNFWLGKTWVTNENINNYAGQLATWAKSLDEGADILLYSCFAALGEAGQALIGDLAHLTGADVAASTNATGSANYGGDWVLESSTGNIEVLTPFSDLTLSVWDGKLATRTVTSSADTNTAGTLRFEIGAATAGDLILFDSARTVNTTGAITWGQADLTIDGNGSTVQGNNTFRIFNSTAATGTTTIQNLTISGGSAAGDGGGMYAKRSITLTNSTVSGNSASEEGGGLFVKNSGSDITLTNSTMSGNSAAGAGGGMYANFGDITLTNSTVSGNSAGDNAGGMYANRDITLTNSTVSGNSAGDKAGGMYTDTGIVLTNSTVSGNSSGDKGGGMYANNGDITLTNSTVSGNSSGNKGGGLFGRDNITLTNSTVSGNGGSGSGGGLYANSDITLTNSIIANNTDNGTAPDLKVRTGGMIIATNSLIENSTGATITGSNNIIGVDPQLLPLGNYGGPTQTHALALTSPALNAGSNALAAGLTTDQRGAPGARIANGTVDMGAFEWQGFEIVPISNQNITISSLPSTLDVSVKVVEKAFNIIPSVGAT